jgi:hypothetical protein
MKNADLLLMVKLERLMYTSISSDLPKAFFAFDKSLRCPIYAHALYNYILVNHNACAYSSIFLSYFFNKALQIVFTAQREEMS